MERLPFDALVSDTLLKILHNQQTASYIEFETNYCGFSFFTLRWNLNSTPVL